MKYLYFPLLLLFIACNSSPKEMVSEEAQTDIERWQPTDYRNQNWHPEEGKYFFSEQWMWRFVNESLSEVDAHRAGDFSVYVDPATGTMMLNRAASLYQDEMTDWIIVSPDGTYISGWTDHDGTKSLMRHKLEDFDDYEFRVSEQEAEFKEFFTDTGESEVFGINEYGWETFMAKAYIQTYKMTNEESTVYTTALPFSARPFYLVENINGDLRLPINFRDYAYLLPEDELVLKEMSEFYGKQVGFEFKSASPTEYFLDVNGYEEVK